MQTRVNVSQLFIYPVKSLAGIALSRAKLTEKGFEFDRHWMIINPKNQFVTQRQLPKMATIKTELTNSELVLSAPHMANVCRVNLLHSGSNTQTAKIWQCHVEVVEESQQVSDWLSEAIDSPYALRLVRMASSFTRMVDQSSKLGNGVDVTTEFADGFPFLVANQSSLDELNQTLKQNYTMDRFRPNIVLSGIPAFAEHQVNTLTHSNYQLVFRFPCERCVITTIDQLQGEKSPDGEPLNTLKRLNPMLGMPFSAAFGENAQLTQGQGHTIHLGDELELNWKLAK